MQNSPASGTQPPSESSSPIPVQDVRVATDSPSRDLLGRLTHRLGLELSPPRDADKPFDSTDDIVDLLLKCDAFEVGRVLQLLADQELPIPLYFPSKEWCPLNSSGLRHTRVAAANEPFCEQRLPRMGFFTMNKATRRTLALVEQLFGKNFASSSATAAPVVQSATWKAQERWWHVMHFQGDRNTLQQNQVVAELIQTLDIVVVQDSKFDEAAPLTFQGLQLVWAAGDPSVEKRRDEILVTGDTSEVRDEVAAIMESIQAPYRPFSPNIPPSDSAMPLLNFLENIKSQVRRVMPPDGNFLSSLPLQKLYTEHLRLTDQASHENPQLQQQIDDCVLQLKRAAIQTAPPIVDLLLEVLQHSDRPFRLLGLKEMAFQLQELQGHETKQKAAAVDEAYEAYDLARQARAQEAAPPDGLAQAEKSAAQLLREAQQELDRSQITLENVWREVSLRYMYCDDLEWLPKLAAQVLLDGGALELVNSEACRVPVRWMGAVVKHLEELVGKGAKIRVTSVCGIQSSGKSTLLNCMFGCEFRAASGAVTRGINMILVPNHFGGYTLVLDCEGLCNPLFSHLSWYDNRNNWLATMAILAANSSLLICNSEDQTKLEEVVPMALRAFAHGASTIKKAGFPQRKFRIVYNKCDSDAGLGANRRVFKDRIHQFLLGCPAAHTALTDLESNGMFFRVGCGLDIPKNYGEKVVALLDAMHQDEQQGDSTLGSWWQTLQLLQTCLESQDHFHLSFQTVMQLQIAETVFERLVRPLMKTLDRQCQEVLQNDIITRLGPPDSPWAEVADAQDELERRVQAKFEGVCDEFNEYFDRCPEHAARKPIEQENLTRHFNTLKRALLRALQVRWNLEHGKDIVDKFHCEWQQQLQSKSAGMPDEQRVAIFEEMFDAQVKRLERENPCRDVCAEVAAWSTVHHYGAGTDSRHDTRDARRGKEPSAKSKPKKNLLQKLMSKIRKEKKPEDGHGQIHEFSGKTNTWLQKAKNHVGEFDITVVADIDHEVVEAWKENLELLGIDPMIRLDFRRKLVKQIAAILAETQKRWEQEHNLACKFKREKPRWAHIFRVYCQGLDSLATCSELLQDVLLNQEFYDAVWTDLVTKAITQEPWLQDRRILSAIGSLNLLHQVETAPSDEERQRVLSRVCDATLLDGVLDELLEYRWTKVGKSTDIVGICKQRILECIENVKTQLVGATFSRSALECAFKQHRPKPWLSWSSAPFAGLEDTEISRAQLQQLFDDLNKALEQWLPCSSQSRPPRWCDLRESPVLAAHSDAQTVCGTVCPLCGMYCHLQYDHSGSHDCYHQAAGLAGMSWKEHNQEHRVSELCETTCIDEVEADHEWWTTVDGSRVKIPYAQFSSHFKSWTQPHPFPSRDTTLCKFREWLFVHYQNDLVALHPETKRCTKLPIQAQDRRDDLKVLAGEFAELYPVGDRCEAPSSPRFLERYAQLAAREAAQGRELALLTDFRSTEQSGGTCYAHASAAAICLACCRVVHRDGGYPDRAALVDEIVAKHGTNGGHVDVVLNELAPRHRIRWQEVDEAQACLNVDVTRRPQVATFYLSSAGWDRFSRFFRDSPTGLLAAGQIGTDSDQEEKQGHAVVLVEASQLRLTFLNSWGPEWGHNGRFSVERGAFPFRFYDVFWYKEDLTATESTAWREFEANALRAFREFLRNEKSVPLFPRSV